MIKSASRMKSLPVYFFAGLNEKIRSLEESGKHIIRLDIGSPDLPPNAGIIDALAISARNPANHGYQSHEGTLALKEAWAGLYRERFNVDLDVETEIVPLLGSKEGIFHLAQCLIEPGDYALIPDPGYPPYVRGVLFNGGTPFSLPLLPENGLLPDLDRVPQAVREKAKLMWLNYPNNPTAATADRAFFESVVEFAMTHHIILCHDAAYTQVTFRGYRAPSVLEFPGAKEIAIEFNTLSKSHNMAGWRVGVAVGNPGVIQELKQLKTNADSGHFRPILDAATHALTSDQSWTGKRNQEYQQRGQVIVEGLRKIGVEVPLPRATIYVWSPIPEGWSSMSFSERLLEQTGVSVVPGTVFGKHGEGFVRISITQPREVLEEAMQCLEDWGLRR